MIYRIFSGYFGQEKNHLPAKATNGEEKTLWSKYKDAVF